MSYEEYIRIFNHVTAVDWAFWDHERYQGGALATPGQEVYCIPFFQRIKTTRRESNMMIAGQIPAPCAMLISHLSMRGITSKIAKGAVVVFQVGAKLMFEYPLDDLNRHRHSFEFSKAIFIEPQICFMVRIQWGRDRYAGGYQPRIETQIRGLYLRPTQ
jgi:hypothetical protein